MEVKLRSLVPSQGHLRWVDVFGYTTKGQPGLEVVGLNGRSRHFKEKLTFISKRKSLRFPLHRYVICVDLEEVSKSDIDWLELPILIAFWSLAQVIPLKSLDQCFTSGKVSLEGEVELMQFEEDFWLDLEKKLSLKEKCATYLGETPFTGLKNINVIPIKSIFEDLNV